MEALNILERKYFSLKSRMKFLRVVQDPANTSAIFEMNEALHKSMPPDFIEKMMDKVYTNLPERMSKEEAARYYSKKLKTYWSSA